MALHSIMIIEGKELQDSQGNDKTVKKTYIETQIHVFSS